MKSLKNLCVAAVSVSIIVAIAGTAGCRSRNAPVFDARNAGVENFTEEGALAETVPA